MVRLLTMFGLREPLATLACTVGVFLAYRAAARACCRIVEIR